MGKLPSVNSAALQQLSRQSRAAWNEVLGVLRNPWIGVTAIGLLIALLIVPVALAAAGILEIQMSKDGIRVGRAQTIGSGPGPRIAGGWRGEISDVQFGEFRRAMVFQLDLTLTRRGDTVWVEGHLLTDSVAGGRYVGAASFAGVGTVSAGEYLRLPFDLKKNGIGGSGVLLLQLSPNGRLADGYALYRRIRPGAGRLGLGKATFTRAN
ncbi:MAG: hypothetical protein ABJF01_20290 [bacterium]